MKTICVVIIALAIITHIVVAAIIVNPLAPVIRGWGVSRSRPALRAQRLHLPH